MSTAESTQAEAIAAAVEAALATNDNATEIRAKVQAVYLAWRNANLNSLPPAAFALVDAASGALVSAMAELF